MILISWLSEKYIGRWVEYDDGHGIKQRGRIKSWNDKFVFVVYSCNNQWNDFMNYTGQPTDPKDLTFL